MVERCTDEQDASSHLANLKEKFLERKYPEELVDQQINRAKKKDRKSQIVQNKNGKNKQDNKLRLIFTHNEKNPPIHQWIRESRKFLERNEKAKVMGKNIQLAYKQPKNIKKLVGGPSGGGSGRGRVSMDKRK